MDYDIFLTEVERFLQTTGLSATRFGVLAAGDTKFVKTLRAGRRPRGSTIDAIREWMREYEGGA